MWTTPRDRFCRLVMATFYDVIKDSKEESPIRRAFNGLGEHVCELASETVTRHTMRALGGFMLPFELERAMLSDSRESRATVAQHAADIVAKTMLDLIRAWEGRRYLLDGEPCDVNDFVRVNDFTEAELRAIRDLRIGDRLVFGGGAVATSILECVGPETAKGGDRAA